MPKLRMKTKTPTKKTPLEDSFAAQLVARGFRGRYRRNHQFIEGRRFAADFWFPALKLAVETDGGIWLGKRGGHTSAKGYANDRERDAEGLKQGIITIRFTSDQVKNEYAIETFIILATMRENGEL